LIAVPLRFALFVGLLGCMGVAVLLWSDSAAVRTRPRRPAVEAASRGPRAHTPPAVTLTTRARAELTHALRISQIERNGELGLFVQPLEGGPAYSYGPLQSGRTWSVIKVPLVLAYLRWRAAATGLHDGSRALTAYERAQIEQAIRESDNRAARHLYEHMAQRFGLTGADRRIERIFRKAGETGIRVPKTGLHAFGATVWRLSDAAELFRALNDGELASRADTSYVLGLMSTISERESWGLKEAYGPGSRVAFKGGWGPDESSQWDLEQVGIVGAGSSGFVIAIMFHTNGNSPNPDRFDAGRSMFNAVAAIIAAQIPARPARDDEP
jgi:hypothetical protein